MQLSQLDPNHKNLQKQELQLLQHQSQYPQQFGQFRVEHEFQVVLTIDLTD